MKKILKYIGTDNWYRPKYQDENGRIYVDIDMSKDPRKPGTLCTVTPDWEEPDTPVKFSDLEITGWSDDQQKEKEYEFEYMMLSSLQLKASDPKAWGYTAEGIIEKMRHYYDLLPVKPVWCTKEDIDDLEKKLLSKTENV